jgi:drug/metabolite transporter (DMT)-like permease
MAVSEVLFFVGFQSTSPTVACAIGNIVPALTFVIAAALKMEPVRLATRAGQAKVVGTLVCVGGSMVMPFYKGPLLKLWASPIHWRYAEHTTGAAAPPAGSGIGDLLIILSAVAWAAWLVMQVRRLDTGVSGCH